MTEVVGWGTGWSVARAELLEPMAEEHARVRFEARGQIAAELSVPGCARAHVIHRIDSGHARVDLHGWPQGTLGRASLHYLRGEDGPYALTQVGLTTGPDDATAWTQVVHLAGEARRAVLDVPSTMTRYAEPLAGSAIHDKIAGLGFAEPAFGDYGHLVRPDLVARCLLGLGTFDPDLPGTLDAGVPDGDSAADRPGP